MSRLDTNRVLPAIIAAGAALLALADGVFMVEETEQAVVARLGSPLRVVNADGSEAGLHLKAPLIDRVARFDRRLQAFEAQAVEATLAGGEKRMVSPVIVYRISDAMKVRHAPGSSEPDIGAALQFLAGRASVQALRRTTARDLAADPADAEAAALASARAQSKAKPAGFAIEQIIFRRIDPTAQDAAAMIRAMQAENRVDAERVKAGLAAERRDATVRTRSEEAAILETARATAARMRLEAAREAAAVRAASYGRDPALADFYRTMQAYETAMANGETTLILTPESPFLKYLRGQAAPAKR